MTLFSRRTLFTSVLLAGFAPSATLFAADKPKEIVIDWATYNPVSMLLKDKGLPGEGIRQGRHRRALGADGELRERAAVPQRRLDRFRLDRRLRRAGRADQRQSDQVGLRLFEDRNGPRSSPPRTARSPSSPTSRARRSRWCAAPTRTSSAVRALLSVGITDKDSPGAGAAACRRRHRAAARRRRRLGRPRSDDGAATRSRTARACSIATPTPTPGASSIRARSSSRTIRTSSSACSRSTRRRANIRSRITTS